MHDRADITAPILLLTVLTVGQVLLLAELLALHRDGAALIGLVLALPLTGFVCWLLTRSTGGADPIQTMSMVAAGGFGMLAGCFADLGHLGLYGMIDLCIATPITGLDPQAILQRIDLMPWTYIGMLAGANLGMWLAPGEGRLPRSWRLLRGLLCNVGMLAGMWLGETLAFALWQDPRLPLAAASVVLAMVLGMGLGMILPMSLRPLRQVVPGPGR